MSLIWEEEEEKELAKHDMPKEGGKEARLQIAGQREQPLIAAKM